MRRVAVLVVVLGSVFTIDSVADEKAGAPPQVMQFRSIVVSPDRERGLKERPKGFPCTCIQGLWADYPGPFDLYFALTKFESCEEVGEEELWYGLPSNSSRPQACDGECEEYSGKRATTEKFPGHGHALAGKEAWKTISMGLEAAKKKTPRLEYGEPEYHIIPHDKLPDGLEMTEAMPILAVPITLPATENTGVGRVLYLCFQVDSIGDADVTDAAFENAKLGRGEQLKVAYQVDDEGRTGLVWLRGPRR
jgi:hypothetical protein